MAKGKTYKFYGSEFKASTAFATGQAITGATNANPCVLTVVAHGIVDHAPVKVAGLGGMLELNDKLVIAETLTVDTIRLVGIDSTNYGVWTSDGTIQVATMTSHCEQTQYNFSSGSTPVTEDETNCGVVTNVGAPRLGSVSIGFKAAENAFQDALEASRLATSEVAFMVQVAGQTKVRYDIGFITEWAESGSSGSTWDGTASVSLTQHRVKVDA
jgi:hypothetical protein